MHGLRLGVNLLRWRVVWARQVRYKAMTGFAMRISRCDVWRKLSQSRLQCISARIHEERNGRIPSWRLDARLARAGEAAEKLNDLRCRRVTSMIVTTQDTTDRRQKVSRHEKWRVNERMRNSFCFAEYSGYDENEAVIFRSIQCSGGPRILTRGFSFYPSLPSFPFPSSSLSFPFPPSSLSLPSQIQLWGMGSAVSSLSGVWDGAPADIEFDAF